MTRKFKLVFWVEEEDTKAEVMEKSQLIMELSDEKVAAITSETTLEVLTQRLNELKDQYGKAGPPLDVAKPVYDGLELHGYLNEITQGAYIATARYIKHNLIKFLVNEKSKQLETQ